MTTDQIAAEAAAVISLYVRPLTLQEQQSASVYIKDAIEKAYIEWEKGLPIKDRYFENVYGKSHKPRAAQEGERRPHAVEGFEVEFKRA